MSVLFLFTRWDYFLFVLKFMLFFQIRIFLKSVSVEIMILKMALILCHPGKKNKEVRCQTSASYAGLRIMLSAKLRN